MTSTAPPLDRLRIAPTLTTVQRALFLISAVETFKPVASDDVAAIATRMFEMRFPAGFTVYERRDLDGRMYVIVDGAIERWRDGHVIHRAGRGGLFGFFANPDDAYEETVVTAEPTHVLALSQDDFVDAVAFSHSFALGLIRGLTRTIVAMVRRAEAAELRLADLQKDGTTAAS